MSLIKLNINKNFVVPGRTAGEGESEGGGGTSWKNRVTNISGDNGGLVSLINLH